MELAPRLIDKILAAEAHMLLMPQVELKVIHHFSHGVYARELHIPAGVTLTGEVHKFENLNILSKGKISVSTEHGIEEIEAPFTIVSPPGTKRIAYAHTDCVWTTVHGTFETDIDKIKAKFVITDYHEYLAYCGQQLSLPFEVH
jgi:hypothetical protein